PERSSAAGLAAGAHGLPAAAARRRKRTADLRGAVAQRLLRQAFWAPLERLQLLLANLDAAPRILPILRLLHEQDRVRRRRDARHRAPVPLPRERIFAQLPVAVRDQAVRLRVPRVDPQRVDRRVDRLPPPPHREVALGEKERGEELLVQEGPAEREVLHVLQDRLVE